MDIKRFTQLLGIVFVALGVFGFIPAFVTYYGTDAGVMTQGLLFGLFQVNALLNIVHIAFGAWAFWACRQDLQSRVFNKTSAIFFGVLAVIGIIPGASTLYGLAPLHTHNIWLHAVIAGAAAFYGYVWHTNLGSKLSGQH